MKESRKILIPALFALVLSAGGGIAHGQDQSPPASVADLLKNVAVIKLPNSRFVRAGSVDEPQTATANDPDAVSSSLLGRVGVQTQDSLALSLDDAIRMALENN